VKVYVLGDSISIGYGPYLEACLRGIMEYSRKEADEEASLNTDNPQGANGGDSSAVLSFLKQKALSGGVEADLLLVNCGLHDIRTDPRTGAKQIPIERYAKNLQAIIDTAAAMKTRLIWVRTTPCDEAVHNREGADFYRFAADCDDYNRTADAIMKEAGVPSIDLHTFTRNLGPDIYCDHVHFHDHVQEKQAAFIADWLSAYARDNRPGDAWPAA